MSITVDPLPAAAPDPGPGPVPDPRDFPLRPMPHGLSHQARRSALRLRTVRAGLCLALAAGVAGGVVFALSLPGTGTRASPVPPAPVEPPQPESADVQVPRTTVGLGANIWVQLQGWCIGDLRFPEDTGRVESCRFMPGAGSIDVAVLDPGRYAPAGYRLVVAVAVGRTAPGTTYRGRLTDGSGTGDMTTDRPAGLPGVVFLWGFTRSGPVDVTVSGPDGIPFASCTQCGVPSR
ncbi:hypothetical protein [Yinghuangia soli]|uniref:Uncharacterized protein n=1 Tax=Yinghuangia soli TaxID=2908204 RepID=A0AA41Q0J4_9ACTN|nr:hypothetical protein [Yinghuangia soli]MCF2528204.1 hypothetical protein [Yinghuangia soli]